MTTKDIPQDSVLCEFIRYLSSTEIPLSYQIAGGLSVVGACLRRSRWIDQVDWLVFPNQSVMFVGPSGIGKDTIISRCTSTLQALEGVSHVPTLGGKTLELIYARLEMLKRPAAAYVPVGEMTAFFGQADYQKNMLTGVTDLLTGGKQVDISTKGTWMAKGGPSLIMEPTITMHAGSTVEWLHKGMPEGTLEGGFMGRFLICCEELDLRRRQQPLVKRDRTKEEIESLQGSLRAWVGFLEALSRRCQTKGHEMILFPEAEDVYTNWYYNRFKLFSRAVMPYANRSRDMVLRLAMLMALSRGHDRWIDGDDMQFAISMMAMVAERIDSVVLPPSMEAQVAQRILDMLPATRGEIYATLGMRYSLPKQIDPAMDLLRKQGKTRDDPRNRNVILRVDPGEEKR